MRQLFRYRCHTALSFGPWGRQWSALGLLLCPPAVVADITDLTRPTSIPVPTLLIGLAVLLACVYQVIRLNHQLRDEIRSRWHTEDELSESRQRLEMALWGSGIGCWDWNLEFDEVLLDQRCAELLGVEAGAGVLNLHDRHPACELFRQLRTRFEDAGADTQLEQVYQLNGRWLQCAGKRLPHGNTEFRALGTLMDISQAHAYQEKLELLSITDSLTGVLNRRHFFERMDPACAQARRDRKLLAVAMLDVDHFKRVNDDYGHLIGDRVLAHFAAMLKRHCRPYDLVARYGGEEFIVLFVGIDREQACTVLSRYREALQAAPVRVSKGSYTCRFSAGIADIAELEAHAGSCDGLVAIADSRLYQAKAAGRDRIFTLDEGLPEAPLDRA